jgi:hypothetical protein
MITDAQTRFSTAQALTTGTQLSTNAYDLGVARDVGRGGDIRVFVNIQTTFTGGTSLQVNVVESANSDLSSASVILTGPVVAEASLLAGKRILDVNLPQTSKRYVGLQYVNVGTHTAGAVDAGMVLDTDSGTTFAANTGY